MQKNTDGKCSIQQNKLFALAYRGKRERRAAHFIPLTGMRRDQKTADSAIGGRKSGPSFALLERVHPVGFEVIKREHQRAQAPGDRIGPGDRLQYGKEFHGEGDVGHADDAPAQRITSIGTVDLPAAAEDAASSAIRQQEEERRGCALVPSRRRRGLRVTGEQADELRGEDEDQQGDGFCDRHRAENADADAFFTRSYAFAAEILADERGQRHREAGDGQEAEALDAAVRAAAAIAARAELVDVALHDDVRDGDDAVLQTGGQAVLQNLTKRAPVETDLAQIDAVGAVAAHQADHAQAHAYQLRNGRRRRPPIPRPCGIRRRTASRARC